MTVRWIIAMKLLSASGTKPVGAVCEAAFRVLPSDLDMLMHMTNGRYLSILDAARIAYMSDTGLWRKLRTRGWHPVVVAQTITYRRPLTLGTRYEVRTAMIGVDARNVYFEQEFHVGATTYAFAVVAVRYLDRSGESVPPARLLALDVDVALPQSLPEWVVEWSEAIRTQSAGDAVLTDSARGTHA
ncbi:thioesterase family protein [Williamsia herbipolensis]|uniref:Thioesterase family protein n=1 Tax=Williamsia herbipolensis TaxID=1603258 RepID=A0AAU4K0P6_9NOCA|nr:thioesterase family protein [Williamsia herbipolensis]